MSGVFQVEDRVTGKLLTIEPRVPFQSELLPDQGSDRVRLAAWVTDPHNQRFSQAIANRIWALMFGRGLVEPIDDIRSNQKIPPALEILADDFAAHGFSLRRMITVISASQVFQLDSRSDPAKPENETPADEITPAHEEAWAVFPIRRLRRTGRGRDQPGLVVDHARPGLALGAARSRRRTRAISSSITATREMTN